jgi:decaprenylphospho-beta-D-erythro-pentofuranosid-2-ulose 2-reductase
VIDATGMPQTAIVIGGSSDIAVATLRLLAVRRLRKVLLAGRSPDALDAVAIELRALGVESETVRLDVTEVDSLDAFAREAVGRLGEIDLVLVAAGDLGTAVVDDLDAATVAAALATNFTGPAAVTMALAQVLRTQGFGRIVLLSSAAGVRVRKANFVYGSAKAGLDGFGLGLADALEGSGVEVTVVRPGFVKTKMTAGMKAAPLSVDAVTVATAIVDGLERGSPVVWVPPLLRPIFAGLRVLPRALWRRLPS